MSFIECCVIKYNDEKHCFISLPKRLLTTLSGQMSVELFVTSQSEPFLLSWVGGVSRGEFAEISRGLGAALDIREGDEVSIKQSLSLSPVRELYVEPECLEDWEILELNAGHLEFDILNQVRVVRIDSKLPIWVHNVLITLYVRRIEPSLSSGMLDNQTEVVVMIPSLQKPMDAPIDSEILVSSGDSESEEVDISTDAYYPFPLRKDSSCSICEHLFQPDAELNSALSGATGIGVADQEVTTSSRKCMFQFECQTKQKCEHHECYVLKSLMLPSVVVRSLRVIPLDLEYLGSYPSLRMLLHHPNVLFISRETANEFHEQQARKIFLGKLSKVYGEDDYCIVMLVVADDVFIPLHNAIVADNLRTLLGLDISSRVVIESLQDYKSSPPHSIGISLHPEEKCLVPVEVARRTVLDWLQHVCSCEAPLILGRINLVDLWIDKTVITIALTLTQEGTLICPNLHEDLLEFAELDLKELDLLTSNCRDLDNEVFTKTRKKLSGNSEKLQEGLSFLNVSLGLSPALKKVLKHSNSFVSGHLLITGCRGSGKTTLAESLCESFAALPFYVFSSLVECARLRGKKGDNVKKHLESFSKEATERRPSIIILDNLDKLAGAVTEPGTEESAYKQRLSELVYDFIMNLDDGVSVIATACELESLHPILSASPGKHTFTKIINLLSPSMKEREELLKDLVNDRNVSVDSEVARIVAEKTSCFIIGDLECVINRALHNKWAQGIRNCDRLSLEDFEIGLKDFTPWSLIGGKFHEPQDIKWENVGGLNECKNILMQILQWPTLFPDLFAQCPLPMNRGILLYGAPGTGKTLLARVVAAECSLKVITVKGPELLSKYIGASEKAVRDVFNRARSTKPCLIFFDEFDSLVPRRGHDNTGVTDRVVNQLLSELDGVESLDNVYILAATSRPDLIDPAILRPGRIDKRVYCPIPNQKEREEILYCLSLDIKLDSKVNLSEVARACEDFTGADIQAMLYNAQVSAISNTQADFDIVLTQEHLMESARSTKPSISSRERKYFINIYQKFQHKDIEGNLPNQRVTLA